jgi:hypothetical protein
MPAPTGNKPERRATTASEPLGRQLIGCTEAR